MMVLVDLKALQQLKDVQEESTDSSDSYMVGLYNGMELMLATIEERTPLFKTVHSIKQPIPEQLVMDIQNKDYVSGDPGFLVADNTGEGLMWLKEEDPKPQPIEQIKDKYFG